MEERLKNLLSEFSDRLSAKELKQVSQIKSLLSISSSVENDFLVKAEGFVDELLKRIQLDFSFDSSSSSAKRKSSENKKESLIQKRSKEEEDEEDDDATECNEETFETKDASRPPRPINLTIFQPGDHSYIFTGVDNVRYPCQWLELNKLLDEQMWKLTDGDFEQRNATLTRLAQIVKSKFGDRTTHFNSWYLKNMIETVAAMRVGLIHVTGRAKCNKIRFADHELNLMKQCFEENKHSYKKFADAYLHQAVEFNQAAKFGSEYLKCRWFCEFVLEDVHTSFYLNAGLFSEFEILLFKQVYSNCKNVFEFINKYQQAVNDINKQNDETVRCRYFSRRVLTYLYKNYNF